MISRGAHREAAVGGAQPLGQGADHLVVGAALAGRIDQPGPELDVLMPAALVEVVVLHEHGRGQHDVGNCRRLREELLVHDREKVLAREAALHQLLLGRDRDRVGVLDEQRRQPAGRPQRPSAVRRSENAGTFFRIWRLVEHPAPGRIRGRSWPFDQRLGPAVDFAAVVCGRRRRPPAATPPVTAGDAFRGPLHVPPRRLRLLR